MESVTLRNVTVAEAYLHLLLDRGIDYFFANAGTDFAPLIEAFAKADSEGTRLPRPVTAPHENVAVSMALGHTLVSGKPQAVMVHVNVGTANALCGILNTNRIRLPMLFTAGRTPILESGMAGARGSFIHWPQEMYDQAGMVREAVKWDYELRNSQQLEAVVDRALSMATMSPAGPVYLTLPREVLAAMLPEFTYRRDGRQAIPGPALGTPSAVAEAAGLLAGARNPLAITSAVGRDQAATAALAELCQAFALPVVTYNPRFVELPSDHPMHLGTEPAPLVEDADVILVVEATAPWLPGQCRPRLGAKVIHLGEDPLYPELPMRSFPCDIAIKADPAAGLRQLAEAMAVSPAADAGLVEDRRRRVTAQRAALDQSRDAAWKQAQASSQITSLHISKAIDAVKGEALVFKESGLRGDHMRFTTPGTYFFAGAAGGLGWSLGAALGAQMAAPDKLVISTVGDGSYMFGTPLAVHYVAAEQRLPVLFVVFNNKGWHAVRRSTRGMYRDGYSARAKPEPLTDFGPDMRYEHMMEIVGGYGECVSDPDDLPKALDRALDAVKGEGRQALLNVQCLPG
ncbi:thiamine pyrophosphate-requiring protein [Oleomonas cavernae]|uniref:Thiamine pyrophosphate-requiring protein n=1 Tax=Oleomonas cavernae TaxID=2320859 RepID=A0A418W8L7_9PROT|nr:thiamine pyrophosphate-requiring protein [Oleomonas cavernae]RJF86355.1 thiamine pyrophosphate-requiring protein [Oleomonas cavernae]